jgi:NAD(P)-dependent dehydrogenase (short-subunit alcohol dehydrogenase family)
MRLQDQVAIITGGAGAIGSATAFAMAREGARIVVADMREAEAENVAGRLKAMGADAIAVRVDVRDSAEVGRTVDAALDRYGRLDIMFNNAGLAIVKPVGEHTDADWNLVLNTDLAGVFFGCRAAAAAMLSARRGVIINTASIIGLGGFSYRAAYSAAKAGIINMTRTVASEVAMDGIRVNAIAPGYIFTDGFKDLDDPVLSLDNFERRIPMGRLGTPEDVAAAAVFLASDEASYITGIVLPVDGGYTAYSGSEPIPSRPTVRMSPETTLGAQRD